MTHHLFVTLYRKPTERETQDLKKVIKAQLDSSNHDIVRVTHVEDLLRDNVVLRAKNERLRQELEELSSGRRAAQEKRDRTTLKRLIKRYGVPD